ncbi:uncharacterized protein LOC113375665 [Ctenocephalides felis]|uniref:uncharacterized protein LOC113375665 n=1 Tax=Ctenocephalides felis TaxID=7515 RepID=UPI000E6E28E2|nr:uncharacterized protein LOC113375665 [Ctenocephalides felis]
MFGERETADFTLPQRRVLSRSTDSVFENFLTFSSSNPNSLNLLNSAFNDSVSVVLNPRPNPISKSILNIPVSESNPNLNITNMAYLSLKDARDMIKSFAGSDQLQFTEFIRTCTFAFKNTDTTNHSALLDYILHIKLGGKAVQAIQYKTFKTFEELKTALENLYYDCRSVSSLQLEFNKCTQGPNETVKSYALQLENILMNLIDATINKRCKNPSANVICSNLLRDHAPHVYQEGLHSDIKFLLKPRMLENFELAITAAVEEEQLINSSKINKQIKTETEPFRNSYTPNSTPTFHSKSEPLSCNYCKKFGHIIKDCRRRLYNEQQRAKVNIVDTSYDNSVPSTSKPTSISEPETSKAINFKPAQISCLGNTRHNLAFANIECLDSVSDRTNLLVDTGAEISLIKILKS